MQNYPVEDLLLIPYLNEEFDEELIKRYISSLKVENLVIFLFSQSIKDNCTLQEEVFGTKYSLEKY